MYTSLDTLSRLKGIETLAMQLMFSLSNSLDTLSRLKGIETRITYFFLLLFAPLDTLSRLKGIETRFVGKYDVRFGFGYAFPFEGN